MIFGGTMNNDVSIPRLGAVVDSPAGPGVVVDRDMTYGEALVRLRDGTEFDVSHGQWHAFDRLTVTGFDADAWVWRGNGQMRAANQG
jgi:hypothetical protein